MSHFNQILDVYQHPVSVGFISSYIPRKCGIATFTKDLTKAINDLNPDTLVKIIAMNAQGETYHYPEEVILSLNPEKLDEYEEAAQKINQSKIDIVCLQHEYGLYGGEAGEYIFKLLGRLRQPIVTTLHTILSEPTDLQKDVLFRLAKMSHAVVAMTPDAKERLEKIYGIDPNKVVIIHHGVADQPKASKQHKKTFGWSNRPVMLMTGLINPDKGIDYVLEAMPAIIKKFPDLLFVIAGQTHPEILKRHGEAYRESLMARIKELGIEKNVQFVNEYLSLEELLKYYEACDIYLTPHLSPQQITSGTLAYALGMGKAAISTPYLYAQEMLADGVGMLVKFKDSDSIAEAVLEILQDPELQAELEVKAYALGRRMSWSRVAERYLILFRLIEETTGLQSSVV